MPIEDKQYSLGQPDLSLRLGDDPSERGDALPFVDVGTVGEIESIHARGGSGYCALSQDGQVKCWGSEPEYLGLGDTEIRGDEAGEMGDALPFLDLGADFNAVGLTVSNSHACAWTDSGQLKCWGNNDYGQLGIEPFGEIIGDEPGEMGDELPYVDIGADVHVIQVAAGGLHSCALTDDGRVKCWGAAEPLPPDPLPDGYEEMPFEVPLLGLGDTQGRVAPLGDALEYLDLGEDARVVAIHNGSSSTCALLDVGALKCWGWNTHGQLGQGDVEHRGDDPDEMGDALPVVDLGPGRTVESFNAGSRSCAWLEDGSVKCWGKGTNAGETRDSMGDNLDAAVTAADLGLRLD